jgi:SPP1 family predicted phage head-tail adaptor
MLYPYPWQNIKDPLSIPPGYLQHAIQLQAQSSTQDAFGQQLLTWNTILSCRAGIRMVQGREVYQTAQFVAQVTHCITFWYPGASIVIEGGQQVLFGKRAFNVQTVDNVLERNRVINLMCVEINGAR